jgi:hypothetical protein
MVQKKEEFDKIQHATNKVLDIINVVIMNQETCTLNILNNQSFIGNKKQKKANLLKNGDAKPRI